ncbi:hypothetical protein A1O7_00611 [Cladophialophora yegresii CBS 114405]|uniref:Mediator complex subunit 15 KIX domain-containing protein n=1 Tax=Cladophialophora yegresii CBS 114405 TaxID=1182544 RepID=W9WGZ9_9EURO|nr:uncharacterized protein A1O7_00611 [Cladophialophora yegresii CBS 114405]EXJ64275.1 hypothetical protein A1O7_00611 [Cladophialophora yegresii CBS 114405]
MNPNQFQNMAGMGRGMPNNMQQQMAMANQMGGQMAAQMGGQMGQMNLMGGQMGGPIGGGMGRPMPPQAAGQMSLNHPSVQQYIFDQLNSQGPFAGWQANVHIRERAGQIKLLVDSLRLVRPPVELTRAIEVALQFERKCFTQSLSREDYVRECSEKLGRIRDQRAQQMNQSAAGVMQGMQGMQIPNQNFMPQMQANQQMQNGIGLPPHLQQQMQQGMRSSPVFNQPQPMMNQGQPAATPNQAMANMIPGNNQQKQTQLPELTPEDNKAINLRAAELAKSTAKEEMRNIVEKMNPQLRQNLAQKHVDPIIYYFRMLATKEFRRRKQMEAGMGGVQMGQVQNQSTQNPMAQGMTANANPLMNDMGRFQEQQAGGLRSQETGELVVPASSTPGMMSEQMRLQQQMLAQQRMGQQNQANNMNPAFIAQQQRIQQAQATKMHQAQLQAQNQAQAQARAQAAAAAAQRGQMQGMQGSNTPLSAINRPVNANVSGASPQTIPRPGSGTPMMNQQMQQMNNAAQQGQSQQQLQLNMQEMQKREQALASFPAPLQALLRQKPQSEWRTVLQQFQQSGQMRRSLSQQTPGMQPGQQPQQGPMAHLQNGAFVGGANAGAQPMTQSLSAGAGSQQGQDLSGMPPVNQAQAQQNAQEMMRQRQMQMQQQQKQQQQQGQPQQGLSNVPGQPQPRQQLTAPQMKLMDQQSVPPTVLNSIRQKAPLPEVKTWYQLKNWLLSNPIENWPVPHVLDIQATHFQHIMKNRNQNLQQQQQLQQQKQQQQPPSNTMVNQTPIPQPQQRQQAPIPGMPGQTPGLSPGQIPFRSPSAEDIAKVRAANPRVANMPDEQIRALLITRHRQMQQKVMQQAGQQGMPQQMQFMPPQAGQSNPPGQQFGMQAPGHNQAAQLNIQGQQHPRPPSGQAAGQPRPLQVPLQPENKALKRPSDDDVIEMPNQNAQAQPQAPGNRPSPFQALTKEQFSALDPQKKQQYMNMQRQHAQQAIAKRIIELQKEVQATMPKPRPIASMDANSRKRITDLLMSNNVKNMLGRFESFLLAFFRMKQDEATIKQLILQRMQLHQQYKQVALQNKIFEPADHFSITADTAEAIVSNITTKFQQTAAQIPNNKGPQRPAQLTPENLSLLEAQEKERKLSLKINQAPPPAPTSTQPPFQIGDPRGQGTPRYATPGLKQEDLKLPTDTKRRKKNQQQTPAAPTPVATSPQAIKTLKPADMYKCPVNGCEHQLKGFATQGELDQHHNVAHKLDMEPVTDPLAFLHESLRTAFNLDENLKQIKKPKTEVKAGGASNIKNENSAATPVPMSKIPSQGASRPISAQGGDVKIDDADDPWSHSNITLDQLRVAFGGDDWDELFPSDDKVYEQQSKFYEAYRTTSERWRKIVEGPNGALTDTSTEKSKSPADASDKEGSATAAAGGTEDKGDSQAKGKGEDDSWNINLDGIEGLDLSGFDELSPFETVGDRDIMMGDSPFESVEKPQLTTGELQFQALGGDLQHPENWTEEQKSLAEFLLDGSV